MSHNPYAPPGSKVDSPTGGDVLDERPPRGGCLTTLLLVMIVLNAVTTVVYSAVTLGKMRLPGQAAWVGPVYLVFALINVSAVVAIWRWRRWGFYTLCASAVLIFAMNLVLGVKVWVALVGFIAPLLLYALVKPMWSHFK